MVLKSKTKITTSKNSYTQYITIPSWIARDSQYPFKGGEEVEIIVDPTTKKIEIRKREEGGE